MVRAAYEKWISVIGREPKPMSVDYDDAVCRHLIDLGDIDGRPAGLIEMVPAAAHLLIGNVAVAPEFQRRGLGRRFLAHAEDVAASLGLHRTRLFTNRLFAVNVKLYLDVGYCIDREEGFRGGVLVHMSKDLQSHIKESRGLSASRGAGMPDEVCS